MIKDDNSRWIDSIVEAMQNLGNSTGEYGGALKDIYQEVTRVREKRGLGINSTYESTIRHSLQSYCKQCKSYKPTYPNLFTTNMNGIWKIDKKYHNVQTFSQIPIEHMTDSDIFYNRKKLSVRKISEMTAEDFKPRFGTEIPLDIMKLQQMIKTEIAEDKIKLFIKDKWETSFDYAIKNAIVELFDTVLENIDLADIRDFLLRQQNKRYNDISYIRSRIAANIEDKKDFIARGNKDDGWYDRVIYIYESLLQILK